MGETVSPSRTLGTHWRVEGRSRTGYAMLKMTSIPGWVTAHSPAVGLVRVNPSPELKHGGKTVTTCKKTQIKCIETSIHDVKFKVLSFEGGILT